MDNTPIYIKMSEKAVEVQELRKGGDESWINGDFYTDDILKRPSTPVDSCVFEDSSDAPCEMYHPIWLPRQDQLQGMIKEKFKYSDNTMLGSMNYNFYHFQGLFINKNQFTSMEQLWLAFVMKEKFNKIWDGKKWIK